MRVLGIDPGLHITGYGLVEDDGSNIKLIEAGVIRTSSDKPIGDRLRKIYDNLSEIVEEYRPETLVLEKIYSHYKHPATAILMGHARGIVCLLCGKYNLQLINYASTHLKKSIVGRGRASKMQVAGMVKTLLNLKKMPQPEDVTDALALAISHLHTVRSSIINEGRGRAERSEAYPKGMKDEGERSEAKPTRGVRKTRDERRKYPSVVQAK